jgi:hypothetical protein
VSPGLRKLALTAHIVSSVGWLGAVVAYLALAIIGLRAHDTSLAQGTYAALESLGWLVIVPFSLAALLTGLVQSLGTEWGLFRHYWVLAKFVLTVVATLILFRYMSTSRPTVGTVALSDDNPSFQARAVVHATGGALMLLTTSVLSVYKPWGQTPWARGERRESSADRRSQQSRKAKMVIGVVILVLLLAVLHHLLGGAHMHAH